MKKTVKTLAVAIVAAATLVVSASAANFTHCADTLKTMGLFQGGSAGYELDRAPTRAEAATMLVRLLGKETEAKALTYTAPFTDLNGWEAPYVQYLYQNKLTTGATATTFAPNAKCDAKMYTTFLLRALGYSDEAGLDFTYNTALDKATNIGLDDGINSDATNFLRDNVVAMSYTALTLEPMSSDQKTLLDKLVTEGAITQTAAQPMRTLMENFKEYSAMNAAYAAQTNLSMDMVSGTEIKVDGQDMITTDMSLSMVMEMNLTDFNKSKIAATGTSASTIAGTTEDNKADIGIYYADGMYYIKSGEDKLKMPMNYDEVMSQIGSVDQMTGAAFSGIVSLTKSMAGNVGTYTVKYAAGTLDSLVNQVVGSVDQAASLESLQLGDMTIVTQVTDGNITNIETALDMSATTQGVKMDIKTKTSCSNIRYGNTITVTLPTDLNTYQEMKM